MFNTRFWEDTYVSDLDPIEKLIFLYAITTHRISICGIYEVSLKAMALETGIDKDMLPKILKRLEKDKKISYQDGWLCVLNYPKHQNYNKTTMVKAISNEIKQIPLEILDTFIGYGYPMDTLLIGYKDKGKVKEQVKDKEVEKKPVSKSDDFVVVWSAYPKKVGKGSAEKAWQKHKPSLAVVLQAIEKQKNSEQWSKDNGQFIPHLATWLNGKRWEDEVTEDKVKTIIL